MKSESNCYATFITWSDVELPFKGEPANAST